MTEKAQNRPETPSQRRAGLVRALRSFAVEDRATTWRLFATTGVAYVLAAATTIALPPILKPLGAILAGLVLVRLFIFVHDAQHGAIFRGDRAGRLAIWIIALWALNAPPIWKRKHDAHHGNHGEPLTLPLSRLEPGELLNRVVTLEQWGAMSPRDRRTYRIVRSPVTVVLGFLTAFMIGQCLAPVIRRRDEWQGLLALATWCSGFALFCGLFGGVDATFVMVGGHAVASAVGMYLLYAQHSYPAARLRSSRDRWRPLDSALDASSFFDMPRWMHWFTGNIGYHHVHHVNPRVPFYRLPEAMAAIPALQSPGRTSWRLRDVAACLDANVWDPVDGRLLSFTDADRRVAESR